MNYFDACYIAKFYLAESDSPRVAAFAQTNPAIYCLASGKTEVISVFHRKFREHAVDQFGFHLLCDQFDADCAAGLWRWLPVDDHLIASSTTRLKNLPVTTFLRAADALHLTSATEEGFTSIYTSDRHMMAAAPAFGLQSIRL
jgi:predicted nucleic acid-binding protein